MISFKNSLAFAQQMDKEDELREYRKRFFIPDKNGQTAVYFTGNSLGLQPKVVKFYIEEELLDWKNLGVEGHFNAKNPWFDYHKFFEAEAKLVGAKPAEVVMMNALSTNLHLMLVSFYQPKGKRKKILMEAGAFPSDLYVVESHLQLRGGSFDEDVILLQPRKGEHTLRTEDIEKTIADNASELALVMMSGVQYYTGQLFNMEAITAAGHKAGALVGFDLAHAVGNVPLQLSKWGVDFACWCTYKYLNSGPGGVGGVYVNEKHGKNAALPRLAGWWGYEEKTRFQMKPGFKPQPGAAGWQLSNAPVFSMAMHKASLDIFEEVGMEALRAKSEQLTGFLDFLIRGNKNFTIITPEDPAQRGCQLSILTGRDGKKLFEKLGQNGIIADWREPNVIRVAPVPLYNTFIDVYHFATVLNG